MAIDNVKKSEHAWGNKLTKSWKRCAFPLVASTKAFRRLREGFLVGKFGFTPDPILWVLDNQDSIPDRPDAGAIYLLVLTSRGA